MPATSKSDDLELRRDIRVLQDARMTALLMRNRTLVAECERRLQALRAEMKAAKESAERAEFSQLPEHLYPQAEG